VWWAAPPEPEAPISRVVDGAGVAVHGHPLTVAELRGGIPGGDTAGMPYSRATREARAARVPPSVTTATARANSGVQAGGGPGDQDLAGLEAVKLTRSADDADRAASPAGAGRLANDGALGYRPGGADGVHDGQELLGEQPGWSADGQGGEQAPLPLSDASAPGDQLLQGGVGVELGAGQVEHVLGPIDHAFCLEQLAQAQRAAAQQGLAEGELAACCSRRTA
jgi:hypothetical protein